MTGAGDRVATPEKVAFRRPTTEDGPSIWRLVGASPPLEPNSCYAYLLLCRDFSDAGVVAEIDGDLAGFVIGYRPPSRPDTTFVWQVGVRAEARGRGLAREMLLALLARAAGEGVRYLEATVTPSNGASQGLFRSLARTLGVPCREEPLFSRDLFPGQGHEEEILFRVGPFESDAAE